MYLLYTVNAVIVNSSSTYLSVSISMWLLTFPPARARKGLCLKSARLQRSFAWVWVPSRHTSGVHTPDWMHTTATDAFPFLSFLLFAPPGLFFLFISILKWRRTFFLFNEVSQWRIDFFVHGKTDITHHIDNIRLSLLRNKRKKETDERQTLRMIQKQGE